MINKKYFCKHCNEQYNTIKEYVQHLEIHKKLMDNKPEPEIEPVKKSTHLVDKIIKKIKGEDIMEKSKEEIREPERMPEERLDRLENAMLELSDMIAESQKEKKEYPQIIPEPAVHSHPVRSIPQFSIEKMLKIIVRVPMSQSGELLKTIQDNDQYELEDINVVKQ